MIELKESENKEQGEVVHYCDYCPSPTLAMHTLAVTDWQGHEEWVCGRHKRMFDVPELAVRRDRALLQRAEDTFQPIKEVRSGKEIQVGEEQQYLVKGFVAGLHDAADILAEGDDEAIRKAMNLKLGFQTYQDIRDADIKTKRILLTFGYNSGLDAGIKAWLE